MKLGKNQYLLCKTSLTQNISYSTSRRIGKYQLLLGESCNSTIIEEEGSVLILVGYAIDANNPDYNEEQMCRQLLIELESDLNNIGNLTRFWGGRYVFFYIKNDNLSFLTDTCGLKSAFFYKDVVASQVRYIASLFNLKEDNQAVEYITAAMQKDKEYSWPLDSSRYREVRRLLPNHLFINGTIKRYQTTSIYDSYSKKDRAKEAARLLQNAIKAASKRKELAITLTAGWDSRLVMAAAFDDIDKYNFVTLQYTHISNTHQDIQVPMALCSKFGAKHQVLKCKELDDTFVARYMEHSENGHKYWIQMTQSIEDNGLQNKLWTKGSCNEISRNSSGILYNWQVNVNILSKLYGILPNQFSKNIISNWLFNAKEHSKCSGYKVLDLFYWEQRLGSWLAECLNEADVVGETFTPFNCRAYFEVLKDVPNLFRTAPNYQIFGDIITHCGMELSEPINASRYSSLLSKIKLLLKYRLHLLYGLVLSIGKQ